MHGLLIERVKEKDIPRIISTFNFPWSTVETTSKKWEGYYNEHKNGFRITVIAKLQNLFIGYGSLLKNSQYLPFQKNHIPEIHDLWIDFEYRKKGYGKKLIEYLENIAQTENYRSVGIGVGLYKDYGLAQRLYVKMGYIPDGLGVTYKYQEVIPDKFYPIDDDLNLWFTKTL